VLEITQDHIRLSQQEEEFPTFGFFVGRVFEFDDSSLPVGSSVDALATSPYNCSISARGHD
jgi:hypothetical protein